MGWHRFTDFYTPDILDTSLQTCRASFVAYQANPTKDTCKVQSACIQNHLSTNILTGLSSAQVILGLAPTILTIMGPSMADVALLSTHKPLLSLMLSIGSPTVFFDRFLSYADPLSSLKPGAGSLTVTPSHSVFKRMIISIVTYVFAIAALVNVIQNAVEVGQRSILNWECTQSYFTLLWAVFPIVIHALTSFSFRYSHVGRNLARQRLTDPSHKGRGTIATYTRMEFLPSSENKISPETVARLSALRQDVWAICIQWIAQLLSVAHLMFGTVTLSSLLFIRPIPSLNVVGRFMASIFVARLIMTYEIAGLRSDGKNDADASPASYSLDTSFDKVQRG